MTPIGHKKRKQYHSAIRVDKVFEHSDDWWTNTFHSSWEAAIHCPLFIEKIHSDAFKINSRQMTCGHACRQSSHAPRGGRAWDSGRRPTQCRRLVGQATFCKYSLQILHTLIIYSLHEYIKYEIKIGFFAELQVPFVLPVFLALLNAAVFVFTIIVDPRFEYLFAVAFMAIGLLLYIPVLIFKVELGFVGE